MKRGLKIFLLSVVGLFIVGSVVCGLGGHIAGVALNGSGPVDVSRINNDWKVGANLVRTGEDLEAVTYRDLLQDYCVPMGNGWRILFNQAWYNTISEGYDETVWLESDESYGYYGLYIWGENVFVRNGFGADSYHNRVVTCTLPESGWPR